MNFSADMDYENKKKEKGLDSKIIFLSSLGLDLSIFSRAFKGIYVPNDDYSDIISYRLIVSKTLGIDGDMLRRIHSGNMDSEDVYTLIAENVFSNTSPDEVYNEIRDGIFLTPEGFRKGSYRKAIARWMSSHGFVAREIPLPAVPPFRGGSGFGKISIDLDEGSLTNDEAEEIKKKEEILHDFFGGSIIFRDFCLLPIFIDRAGNLLIGNIAQSSSAYGVFALSGDRSSLGKFPSGNYDFCASIIYDDNSSSGPGEIKAFPSLTEVSEFSYKHGYSLYLSSDSPVTPGCRDFFQFYGGDLSDGNLLHYSPKSRPAERKEREELAPR